MKKKKRKRKSCIGRRRKYTKSGGKTKHPGQGVIPAPAPAKRPRTTIPHVKTQELPTTTTAKEKRVAIYVYWNDSLGASGPTTWQGRDGAIASIRRELNIPTGSYNTIKKVLEDAWDLHLQGKQYTGTHRSTGKTSNNKPLIAPGSTDEQLVADLIEDGCSIEDTTEYVNIARKADNPNKVHVGESAVRTVILRLNPNRSAVSATAQGSLDPDSAWSIARRLQFQQHRLRLGRQKFRRLPVIDQLRACFQNLTSFKYTVCVHIHTCARNPPPRNHSHTLVCTQLYQVTYWDETHPKCTLGGLSKGQDQLRFPRGPNGRLDVKQGQLNPKKFWLNHKYGQEIRIMLGCVMKKDSKGNDVGVRLPVFDYTGCWVHSIGTYEDVHIPAQIHRVKTGGANGWTEGRRKLTDPLFKGDTILRMPGIKKKTAEKLEQAGVMLVNDFCKSITDVNLKNKILAIRGVGKKGLQKWQTLAMSAHEGEYVSKFVDHRRAENPYKSKYGDDWRRHVANDLRTHNAVCVTELIEHMVNESAKFYKNTKYEDTWYFYHDALSQLSDKKTKAWMREKGYMKRWLLPVNGCCAGTLFFGRPVGNTPEVMPWDAFLNRDVHARVRRYSVMSRFIKQAGPDHPLWSKRFDTSTPKRMLHAYMRVLDPVTGVCPSSKRIVEDIKRCWGKNIDAIVKARGIRVPNLGCRSGKRAESGVDKRGGLRKKKKYVGLTDMHPDAALIWEARRELSRSKFEK